MKVNFSSMIRKYFGNIDKLNKLTKSKASKLDNNPFYKKLRSKLSNYNKVYLYHFGNHYPLTSDSKSDPLIYFILSTKRLTKIHDPLVSDDLHKDYVFEFKVSPTDISDFIFDYEFEGEDYEEYDDGNISFVVILPRSKFDEPYLNKYTPIYPDLWMKPVKLVKSNFSSVLRKCFGINKSGK